MQPTPQTEHAEATGRLTGAQAMLTALQEAGVRVPLSIQATVAAPLLMQYRGEASAVLSAETLSRDMPPNEARLIAERTA